MLEVWTSPVITVSLIYAGATTAGRNQQETRHGDHIEVQAQQRRRVPRLAVRNRIIAFNPCEGVRLPAKRKRDADHKVISRDDLRGRLLPAVPTRYRGIVATAAGTGLRRGEAAGLCLDALDLDRRRLRVIRTVVEVSGQNRFKAFPKSAAGRGTVPLPSWLLPVLAEHLAAVPRGDHGLLFGNSVGKPLRRSSRPSGRPSSTPRERRPAGCGSTTSGTPTPPGSWTTASRSTWCSG